MAKVHLEIDPIFEPDLHNLAASVPGDVEIVSPQRFDGTISLGQALITLSTASIPLLGKIVIEAIRAKKHVVIKTKGITITGCSEKNAIQILEKIMNGN